MHLKCILDKLNEYITVGNQNFTGAKYHSLAYLVSRETQQQFPAIIKEGNVEEYIGIDDTHPLVVYHRLLSKVFVKDPYDHYTAQCQMVMVVFGQSAKLKMDAETLESQLIAIFPEKLTKSDITGFAGIAGVRFALGTTNLIAAEVFNQEYKNTDFRLSGEHILFSHRYSINVEFQKSCLDFCERADIPKTLCDWLGISTTQEIQNCLTEIQTEELQALICTAATAVLKNTEDTTLSTTQINAGATGNIIAPDAEAVIKNSLGTVLHTEDIASGDSENIILPDVNNVNSDGVVTPTPNGVAFTCTPQIKIVELYFAFTAGTDTSALATNGGTTWTLTAQSQDGGSGTITVSVNGAAYGAFSNPTTITNAQTIQVKRTTTTGAGWVLITGTYA